MTGAPARTRYRWAVLAAGTAAQASLLAMMTGLAVLAPELRDDLGWSLTEVGVVISAPWVGSIATLLPWGLLSDRVGERLVLAAGLGLCGTLTIPVALTTDFLAVVVLLGLAGAAGASVNSASGRAVMSWFRPQERGLALGIRQTSTPLGGAIAALALPPIEDAGGLDAAFVALGAFAVLAAAVAGLVIRDTPAESGLVEAPSVLRNGRLWLLGTSGALYLVAQVAVTGFLVLFLHEEHGLSTQEAAAVLAAIQGLAVVFRIAVGRWSDVLETRIRPLRLLGLGAFASLAVTAALLEAPTPAVVTAFVVAGAFSMSWNGLSFTAAAELVGRARSGAAIGFQQTVLVVSGAAVPPLFAAVVEATSWQAAFALAAAAPLAGLALLVPLGDRSAA
jgi:sugar phosphate permease